MMSHVILMVGFCGVEHGQGLHSSDDVAPEGFRLIQLIDVSQGDLFLFGACEKDFGAILSAFIRSLSIQQGRVVYREKDVQQLSIGNLRWIVDDLHGFRMSGLSAADDLIMRGSGCPTCVSRR